MPISTINPRLPSGPIPVGGGNVVTVTPGAGGAATVEYTNGSAADISNGVAIWSAWPSGTVYAQAYDCTRDAGYIRVSAFNAPCTVDVDNSPAEPTLRLVRPDWLGTDARQIRQAAANAGSSLMCLGDSITVPGLGMPHLPKNRAVRYMTPTATNLNANGLFVREFYTAATCPGGNGTLRFYAADSTITWQANGDTEGPRQRITMEACFYRVESGSGGKEVYLALIPRSKPTSDKADVINVSGTIKMRNHCASNGIIGWTNTLLGNPFDEIYPFCVSAIRASDWWAARAQWQGIYTDVTHVFLGTNDVNSRETAAQALIDVESIVRARQAIGSRVVVGCLLPYDDRTVDQTQAAVEFNIGIRAMAQRLGVRVWDAWPYVGLSTGAGAYAPGMSGDGLHPAAQGSYAIAKRAIVPQLAPLVRMVSAKPFAGAAYDAVNAPFGNLLANPQLAGTVAVNAGGVSGELPTSWTAVRETGTNITAVSKAPASAGATALPDGIQGNYWTVTMSNAGGVNGEGIRLRPSSLISAGFAPGDYVVFEGEFRISGTGIQTFSVTQTQQGGLAPSSIAIESSASATTPIGNMDGDTLRLPFRSFPILIESATTSMSVALVVLLQAGGSATVDLSPVGLGLHKVPAPV